MSISRRALLRHALCTPALLSAANASFANSVQLTSQAIVVNGKPIFLVSGSLDYFRCPHQQWRDILLRAKRAGLNTIAFYIAWNFHEEREGEINFAGDRDLGKFIDLCGELGLYAWPRFGPFICDEWEAGGYPAWLMAKPGIELRTLNDPALACIQRWINRLMPILVSRQATRGGPVILLQQENEYFFVARPHVAAYQDWLIQQFRQAGVDVPITDCNGTRPETRRPDSLLTLNGGGAGSIQTLRNVQPGKPAIISELYTDYMNCWGWPVTSYPSASMLQQQTMETLAVGGMYSYFTMYGGTNFGFWAATTWKSDQSFVTTRYFARSPIQEGGALSETYFRSKAVNLLALNFQEFLTNAEVSPLPCSVSGPVRAQALRAPAGFLLFVHPEYPTTETSVYHTDGQNGPLIQTAEEYPLAELAEQGGTLIVNGEEIEMAEPSSYPSMLPFQLQLDEQCRVDFANTTILGRSGRVLFFRGKAGARGIVSLNSKRSEWVFEADRAVEVTCGRLIILALSHELADRCWFADGRVLIGPAFVGDEQHGKHECFLSEKTNELVAVSETGTISRRPLNPSPILAAHLPLRGWSSVQTSEQPWRDLAEPQSVETLGAYYGYTWYRAQYRSETATHNGLLLTHAADRVHVFLNGRKQGVWGRGPGALRDPLPLELRAGDNELTFLCDNMGRLSEGGTLDLKGIGAPAYLDARRLTLPQPEWSAPSTPPTQSWQFQTFRSYSPTEQLHSAGYDIEAGIDEGLQLSLRWFPPYAWIAVDGKVIAEHAGDLSLVGGVDFSSVLLDVSPGKHRLDITVYGAAPLDWDRHVALLAFKKTASLTGWQFSAQRSTAVWRLELPRPRLPGPYFLVTEGLSKGQAYLNGHALGRYWEIGPQHSLFVPDPWFDKTNVFEIFDEEDKSPERVYLVRDSRVSIDSVWA